MSYSLVRARPSHGPALNLYHLSGLGQTTTTPNLALWRSDVTLARQAGIPVLVLKAIRQTESGGHANAIRFEPRIFNMLTGNRFQSQFPSDTGSRGTGTAPPAAFNRAYALDPTNAVKATSWGSYQVLIRDAGPQIWSAAGQNPARFIQMFNADPQGISERILTSWFANRPPAQQAAQAYDWVELAHRYNGASAGTEQNTHYSGNLRTAYARWAPEWQQVAPILARQIRNIEIAAFAGITVVCFGVAAYWYQQQRTRAAA